MTQRRRSAVWALLLVLGAVSTTSGQTRSGLIAPGAEVTKVADDYQFTEGPAPDAQGNVFFSDVRTSRCYRWMPDGHIALVRQNTGNASGLAFDRAGNLLACEGGRGRVVSFDPQGRMTVVADQYAGRPFNQPNDLWIDPEGGVYFSDPIYGPAARQQDGEHVYYVSPDRKTVLRVIDDMVRPNGLVGTPDGRTLYVTDHGAKKTFAYAIGPGGRLSQQRLYAPVGADGMKLDREGHLYMAERGILVYDGAGKHVETIDVPDPPTNICFAGPDGRTLFITARPAIYTLRMRVAGVPLQPAEAQP